MHSLNRCAKVNVKVLIVLILVTVALGSSLFAAREVRRGILSKMALDAGQAAFEKEDWPTASKNFQRYLGRNPDDLDMLRKYAQARLSVRPLDAAAVSGAIAAYRRIIQLDPLDEVAYNKLAMLYTSIGNFEELAYIARIRLNQVPEDRKAPLWLAEALNRLRKKDDARKTLEKFIEDLGPLADKPDEYVQACTLMSQITSSPGSLGTSNDALDWLNRAVAACPKSVEALAYRARFYRTTQDIAGMSKDERLKLARNDLEKADELGTDSPRIRLFLAAEWLGHDEFDRTAAELQAIEGLPQEALEEHFFDINNWTITRFIFASQLAMKRKAITEGVSLADGVLDVLTEPRHRVQVIPAAIQLYAAAGETQKARERLKEYREALRTQQQAAGSGPKLLALLEALVARAEAKPYVVIDLLRPVVVDDASDAELWGLLAEAYSQTGQPRQAVSAMSTYLRFQGANMAMTQQLAKEYTRLGAWEKALGAARLAESLQPTDLGAKLIRIGASIYLAAEQGSTVSAEKLKELSAELAALRQEQPDRVDIRMLQASVATYLGDPNKAEQELKQAIQECKEPLRAQLQLVRHYQNTDQTTKAIEACQGVCERHAQVAEPWLTLSDLYVARANYEAARGCLKQGLDSVVDQPQKRSLSIRLASLELIQGDRAGGIRLLSRLAQKDPNDIQARSLLLFQQEIRQDPNQAEKLVRELEQAEGESGLWWRLHEASLWLSSDGWRSKQRQITDYLQYCIGSDPGWSPPVVILAAMYEGLEDARHAEDVCRQGLAQNPAATDIADTLLTLLERQGRFSEAQQVLQQIRVDARLGRAWQIRAALGAGDVPRAIDELKQVASNDERYASSRIQLARLVYQQEKDVTQALTYLKEAEAIAPSSRTLAAVKASILRAEGQTQEAQRILDEYVADSNDFTAYWMRAVYLAEEGEFERAEKDYRRLTTFSEQGSAGYSLLANFYFTNKRLAEAVTTLQEGLDAHPADLKLKRELMKVLFVRADPEDRSRALEILAALEEGLPQDPELMTIRAYQMIKEPTPKSLQAARQKLEDAIKIKPTAVDAHLLLVGIALQAGQYTTARDCAIRALGMNPNHAALLSARARAELALGNAQMAAEMVRSVLEKTPDDAPALEVFVQAALRSQDRSLLQDARARIESAMAKAPAQEPLRLARADVLAALGLPQAALPDLQAYCQTEQGRTSIPALATLAKLYRLMGDMDQAERCIDQAQQLDPASQIVLLARLDWASSLYQSPTGNPARAKEVYQKLLEQHPNDIQVLNDLAWVLQEQDHRYEAALELANRGLSLAPNDSHLLDTRATILSNMPDRLADARKDFEKLVELSSSDPRRHARTLLKLGRTCVKLNDLVQAKRHLQNALEIDRKINVFTTDERSEITNILQTSGVQATNR